MRAKQQKREVGGYDQNFSSCHITIKDLLGDMKHNRPSLYFIGCTHEVKTEEAAYTDWCGIHNQHCQYKLWQKQAYTQACCHIPCDHSGYGEAQEAAGKKHI